jgi:hypothetical protein
MKRIRLIRWYLDGAVSARKHGRYGTARRKLEQAERVIATFLTAEPAPIESIRRPTDA